MILRSLIFTLVILSGIFAAAQNVISTELQTISQDPLWQSLLHFKKGSSQSDIKDKKFFLSAKGYADPLAELIATIEAINSDKKIGFLHQHPICAYPARYTFLTKKLNLDLPKIDCEKWTTFFNRFKEKNKISIIFSSAFPNNPASMFGHLFLKIGNENTSGLNDIGINYAAQVPTTENPVAFLYFGVFGGYEGHWSVQPYYEKINEYLKAENRDLWEYDLNLTANEIDLLIMHLWELETAATTPYYFFDENCAYQIVRLVEAVKPNWSLSDYTIYAIPGEIIKNLFSDQTYIKNVHYRPSLRKRLLSRTNQLNEEQKKNVLKFIRTPMKEIIDFNPYELNTLNSYYDYQRHIKKDKLTSEENSKWSYVLQKRAKISEKISEPEIVSDERPEIGHDSYALGITAGSISIPKYHGQSYLGLEIRSAYHDILNNDDGFLPFSQILFPFIQAQVNKNETLITKINLVDIISLNPANLFETDLSWRLNFLFDRINTPSCLNCLAFNWNGGLGLSYQPLNANSIFFNFLGFKLMAHEKLEQHHHFLFNTNFGIVYLHDKRKYFLNLSFDTSANSKLTDSINSSMQIELANSFFLSKNKELRLFINSISTNYTGPFPQKNDSNVGITFLTFFK